MKRASLVVSVLAAMVALSSFAVYADDAVVAPVTGPNFIDEDGDGICDNNPDGVKQMLRDGSGKGRKANGGNGPNFVDADGDGVCDNNHDGVKQMLRDGSGAAAAKATSQGGGNGRRGGGRGRK
jgi:hypothetical protein